MSKYSFRVAKLAPVPGAVPYLWFMDDFGNDIPRSFTQMAFVFALGNY